MRKIILAILSIALIVISCSKDGEERETITFADIEQEFNFPKPLTSISKELILEKYGSIEKYRSILLSKQNIRLKNNI